MKTLNNLLILKPYQQGQGVRAELRGGLVVAGQKHNLVGLELLADAKIDGETYSKGSIAYLSEDILSSHDWAKRIRKSENVDGDFIVVESRHITAIKEK